MANTIERPIRRCRPSEDIVPFSECRNKLSSIMTRVQKEHRSILVTQNGRAGMYLVNAEDMDALNDQIDLYNDINASRREFAEGKGIPTEEVFKNMQRRIKRIAAKRGMA